MMLSNAFRIASITFAVILSCGFADEIIITESKIISVALNSHQVEVNRTFDASPLSAGYHTIILTQLPQNIDENSITVEGKGSADLLSTTQVRRTFQRLDTPDYVDLRMLLQALRDSINGQIGALSREMSRYSARVETLKRYIDVSMKPAGEAAASVLPLDKMTELLDAQDREVIAANAKILDLENKKKDMNNALMIIDDSVKRLDQAGVFKPFTNRLAASVISDNKAMLDSLPEEQMNWAVSKTEKDLHIKVYVDKSAVLSGPAKLSFFVSYMASPAQWSADYDLKIDKTSVPASASGAAAGSKEAFNLNIAFYAAVQQSTGEDWEDVDLHLSTADPMNIWEGPHPLRRQVQFWKPIAQPMMRAKAGRSSKQTLMMRSAAAPQFDDDMGAAEERDNVAFASAVAEGGAAMAMDAPMDMSIDADGAEMSKAGDLGATYVFSPKHKVTVRSNSDPRVQGNTRTTAKTRLFISDVTVAPLIYSYIVPTFGEPTAHLKSWCQYTASSDAAQQLAPLLASSTARVFLEGSYVGTTMIPTTQPGATMRLNLGEDKKVTFKSSFVLPREMSKEEDKSTWFVTDKEKFHVKHTEYAFTMQNTHEADHLVVMSEYIPHAVDEAIKVEMLSPSPAKVVHLSREGSESDVWSEEEFVDAVLQHPLVVQHPAHPMHAAKKASLSDAPSNIKELIGESRKNEQFVFLSKGSNNLIWAQWVKPGQSVTAALKYKIIWPDGKEITMN